MTEQVPSSGRIGGSEFQRLLTEQVPGAVWSVDTDLRFTASFGAGLAALGLRPGEVVGKTLFEFFQTGDERFPPIAAHRRAIAGQPADYEQVWQARTYRVHLERLVDETGAVLGCIGFAHDVTEQKRAEEELRRSDAQWRSVIANTPAFVVLVDPEQRIRFINRTTPGLPLEAAIGMSLYDFTPPEFRDRTRECVVRALRTGGTACFETLAGNPGGSVAWYEARVSPVILDGEIVAASLIANDITERKQAAAALQESEERFRKVFEQGPLGVVLADLNAQIKHVNRQFCAMLGYTEEEIIARGIAGISHPEDWEKDRPLGQRVLRGEILTYTIDKRYVRKDGQILIGQLTTSMMHAADGTPTAVIGMVEDITERKRVEAALLQNERRLARLLANLPGAAYRCKADPDWTVELLSDGYFALTGIPAAERIGQPGTRHAALMHPDDRQLEYEQVQKAVAQKLPYQVEYRLRTVTGEEKWLWERGVGVFSDQGELEAIEGFTTDITARKEAKAALQRANTELDRKVHERTAELADAHHRLALILESITDGFVSFDRQWRYTYVNQTAARLLNTTPEYLLGKVIWDVFPQTVGRKLFAEFTRALEENVPVHFEEFYPEPFHAWFDCHAYPLPNGLTVYFTDATERKRAEEALQQSEAKYKALVQSSPDAVAMCDLQGRIRFASEQAAVYYGAACPDELVGRLATDLVVPADRDRFRANTRRLIDEGVRHNDQYKALRKDGTTFFAEISSAVIRNGAGQPEALMGVYRDITERKQAQAKIRSEQRALRRMIQAGDHERRLITFELHDGVAQQLLGTLMLFESLNLGRNCTSEEDRVAFTEGMETLRQAAGELRRLMNHLRAPTLEKFGLVQAIADQIAQLQQRPQAPEIDYHTAVRFDRLEPTLENSIFRIAQEALTNACRHSQSRKVRVVLLQRGETVTLEVRDWGTGFDPDLVSGDRFGLEGMRERARLLGAKLKITSRPGKGTLIRVQFPLLEPAPPGTPAPDRNDS